MNLPDFKYCYLDWIYTDIDDNSVLYHLTLSDVLFTKVYSLIADKKLLTELAQSNKITDFKVSDGVLMCDSISRVLLPGGIVANTIEQVEGLLESNNFYKFLIEGIENKYYFIGDSVAECDSYIGSEISSFEKIKFSKSTMSVYVPIVSENGLYNKMLITAQNGLLSVKDYHYLIPLDKSSVGHNVIRRVMVNNLEYHLCKSKVLNIYLDDYVKSAALINKACISREKSISVINTMLAYKEFLTGVTDTTENEKLAWAGGNKSYKEFFGVYFKASLSSLSKNKCFEIVDTTCNILANYPEYNEAIKHVVQVYSGPVSRTCAAAICYCTCQSENLPQLLSYTNAIENKYRKELLYTDLFLYSIRTGSYARNSLLADPTKPILRGSEEKGETIVEQNFKRC